MDPAAKTNTITSASSGRFFHPVAAVVPLSGAFVLLSAGLVRLAAYGRRHRHEV